MRDALGAAREAEVGTATAQVLSAAATTDFLVALVGMIRPFLDTAVRAGVGLIGIPGFRHGRGSLGKVVLTRAK